MNMTRRTAITATAAAAAAIPLSAGPSDAAAPMAGKQAPGFYRYKIGAIEITAVTDGARTFPLPDTFVLNAKKDEVNAALQAAYMEKDKMTIPYTPIVINTGSKLILIDTGNGEDALAASKGAAGQLKANLAASGIDAKNIDLVIISHFHADHVNGLIAPGGGMAFPNAEIAVPAKEFAYWMDDGEMSRAPKGRMEDLFKNNRRVFDPIKNKVTRYEWDKELAPGILAMGTPGHTPGHTSFMITSGANKVFVQSDVTNHPALFVRNPGWHAFFDQDPAQAEATRRKTFNMVVAEKAPVQGFHFPFPSLGHIEKDGNGYRLAPAPWNPAI